MSWFRTNKRFPDSAVDIDPARKPESETAPAQEREPLLSLQRSAGNQAVQKMLQSRGEPIPEAERKQLEGSFGQDLGDLRIHRDREAAELAAGADASAFTTGRDIYFAPGAYSSPTLAHEVGHAIQQSQATSFMPGEDASLEHQASAASSAASSGHAAAIPLVAAAPALQRQPAPGAPKAGSGTEQPAAKIFPTDSLAIDGFEIDKSALNGSQTQKLDKFAERLIKTLSSAPASIVTIIGFADAPGTEPHNIALGQRRADAVRDYLVSKGVPEAQLYATSLGEASPVVPGQGYESRNRRVEINVVERGALHLPAPSPAPSAPTPVPVAVPAHKPPDLTYHPELHPPTPSEELQERLREVDEAVREAQRAERVKGVSAADVTGRILRHAAKKLGLPQWAQDEAESIGRELPSAGAKAVIGQLSGNAGMDAATRDALKALVDALMKAPAASNQGQ